MGLRGGGEPSVMRAGVIHPSRIPRSRTDSRPPARGGTISATGRPRSVTTIVSPEAASRTYSLSLFFRVFRPTVFIRAGWPLEATLSISRTRVKFVPGTHGGPAPDEHTR